MLLMEKSFTKHYVSVLHFYYEDSGVQVTVKAGDRVTG